MRIHRTALAALAAVAVTAASPAFAHITLVTKTAPLGGYLAVFQVPHGCDGAATTAIRIQIPTGVYGVKPQPKAGWKIEIVTGKYAVPFTNKGTQMTEGVTQINFTGGNLLDAYYDVFTLNTSLADSIKPGSTVYFPVVQECEGGKVDRWIDIPVAGQPVPATPAPSVVIAATP